MIANYNATVSAIAQFILDHAPEGLRECDINRLQGIVSVTPGYSFYGVDWRRVTSDKLEAHCTLSLDFDSNGDIIEDSEGNLLHQYRLIANVSWPSYGAASYVTSKDRIQLMKEVCDLAEMLNHNFTQPFYSLVKTKAERQEQEAKREALRIDNLATNIVSVGGCDAIKGMRIGNERAMVSSRLQNLPLGTYTVNVGLKEYQLKHTKEGEFAVVTRTK